MCRKEWLCILDLSCLTIHKYIQNCYELLQIIPAVFKDDLAVILQVPLVDKSLLMNIYKMHNSSILHPILQMIFQYSLEVEYLAVTTYGDYITICSGHDVLISN